LKPVTFAAAALVALAVATASAKIEVKVNYDKTFDFKTLRTWAWNPGEPGQVKMARTPNDDPESVRKRAEPLILQLVETEMVKRGLQQAGSNPDVVVTYYLLMTTTMTSQTMGQFLPSVPEWGIPPFAPATQSLEVMNQGSLVLDLSVKSDIKWRGVAQAKLSLDADDKKREALLREAVQNLLKKYPPKA